MKIIYFILLIVLVSSLASGQTRGVDISYEKVGDGLYDFYAENTQVIPMQLELWFPELENMSADCELPYVATIKKGKTKILTIKRDFLDLPGSFNYKYNTRIGDYPVNHDPGASYLLPVGNGKTTAITRFDFSRSNSPGKIVLGFSMTEGDTIFAARDGIIGQLFEARWRDSVRIGQNSLTILHNDGTMGKYEMFADHSFFPEYGQHIKSGEPLGLVYANAKIKSAQCRFSVYYVNTRIDSIVQNNMRSFYTYVDPLFKVSKKKPVTLQNKQEYSY